MENSPLSLTDFYKTAVKLGLYTEPERLAFYLEQQLFKNIDFTNKRVIDIGGGSGLFGFYAALLGAAHVVVLEPEFDGSSTGMNTDFQTLKQGLGNPENIELVTDILENYDIGTEKFDLVLLHNSINHIDEEGCINLLTSEDAQHTYSNFFKQLSDVSNDEATLIICDCTNKNLFYALGLTNPLMKTIEWEKHQPPEVWANIAGKFGYRKIRTDWTSLNALSGLGRVLFGNRLMSYLTLSHFRLEMRKTTESPS